MQETGAMAPLLARVLVGRDGELAALRDAWQTQQLIAALAGRPDEISRFLGLIAGSVRVSDFFAPASVAAILGEPQAE